MYEVSLKGFDELEALWQQSPKIVAQELNVATTQAVNLLQRETVDRTPTSYGLLRASIQSHVTPLANGMLGKVSSVSPYAIPVELGTKPHYAPIKPLIDWVKTTLGIDGKAGKSIAYAIRQKIAKKGTKGQFMFKKSFAKNEMQIQGMYLQALQRITNRLADNG